MQTFRQLVTEELFSVIQRRQRLSLFLGRPGEDQADVSVAKVGRKMNLGDSH